MMLVKLPDLRRKKGNVERECDSKNLKPKGDNANSRLRDAGNSSKMKRID